MTVDEPVGPAVAPSRAAGLREATRLALRLGATPFGGPAAHVAMLREEAVVRRKWLDDREFLDFLGLTNLIPGPNSTEMVMHTGAVRAGRAGLVAAGIAFILPAALMVTALAWAYQRYGTTASGERFLIAVKPVVIAVVLQAIWGLAKAAPRRWDTALIGLLAILAYMAGVNELVVLVAGGAAMLLIRQGRAAVSGASGLLLLPGIVPAAAATSVTDASLWRLFLSFLKIGSVLYGSGYVLLAFLRGEFVERLHWLTEQQLLDAITVGQITPGPVFTTATFVGYLVHGWSGAAVATAGIFLPAFLFVGITHPFLGRLRRGSVTGALLDGVNLAALGLMAAVTWDLGREAIISWWTAAIAVVALVALVRYRVNSTWLILAAAAVGLVYAAVA